MKRTLTGTLPRSESKVEGETGIGRFQAKESILDLGRFIEKSVRVKLAGGREGPGSPRQKLYAVEGTLKGYDQLMNLVLDECVEYLQDPEDKSIITDNTRQLGLIVARGTAVTLVAPTEGTESIANPFAQQPEI